MSEHHPHGTPLPKQPQHGKQAQPQHGKPREPEPSAHAEEVTVPIPPPAPVPPPRPHPAPAPHPAPTPPPAPPPEAPPKALGWDPRHAVGERTAGAKLFLVSLGMHKSQVVDPEKSDVEKTADGKERLIKHFIRVDVLPVWAESKYEAEGKFREYNGIVSTSQPFSTVLADPQPT